MTGVLNRLRGQVRLRVECAFPERVLNLLGAKGILFWDLQWESEICLRLRMLLEQGPALEEIARQTGAEMTVLRRRGIPVLWGRFHRRGSRSFGCCCSGEIFLFGSFG